MSCGMFEIHVSSRNFLETRVNHYIKPLECFWGIQLDAEEEKMIAKVIIIIEEQKFDVKCFTKK